jgi:hypothetical protein
MVNSRAESTRNDEVDITDIDSVEEYIKNKLVEYQEYNWKDGDLWEQFQDDFSDFTEESFKSCKIGSQRQLRAFLRTRGVKVTKVKNITIAHSLFETTKEEDQADWSAEEIQNHLTQEGPFLSYRINRLLDLASNPSKLPKPTNQPIAQTIAQPVDQPIAQLIAQPTMAPDSQINDLKSFTGQNQPQMPLTGQPRDPRINDSM